MTGTSLPVWRSLLYVPVINPRFVEKSAASEADGVILDLEDSIPAAEKKRARSLLTEAASTAARGGADILVRVNRPWRLLVRDLEAAVIPGVAALALPKIESAEHVQSIAEIVGELETERGLPPGAIRFLAMIENAGGFFRIEAIARSDPRVVAVTIGAEDLALSLGMLPEAEGLFYPYQQSVFAARAAGILPLGFIGTVADYKDLAAFRATVQRSRKLGFMGAACIHPTQIGILNDSFAPSGEEIRRAERMVAAYDAATAAGRGAVEFEGRMIDVPVVERAKQTLERAAVIRRRKGG
jgi:citrate lyase subunit beta/citryl-CoA lyase